MRTFLLICFIALIVAVGMGFMLGVLSIATSHPDGQYIVTLTVNTNMIKFSPTEANANEPTPESLVDIKGKVTAVRPEKNELVVSENVKNWTFRLARDAKVIINDQESKLADVQPGDDAVVSFDRQAQLLIASTVRCTRK
jgi:hypothetical protein